MPNPDVSIEFDNGKINYRPGELLAGRVLVRVDSPLTVKGIHVSFKGDVFVAWIIAVGKVIERLTGTDNIFSLMLTVFGTSKDATDRATLTLAKGDHKFEFDFTIPLIRSNGATLPGSFREAATGAFLGYPDWESSIRYFVECHVERPALRLATRVSRDVHLSWSVDLSKVPGSAESQEAHRSKDIICCCSAGHIDVVIKTDKGGYLPGESMRVSAKIVNNSAKDIKEATLYLAKTTTYESDYGSRRVDEKMLRTIDRTSKLKSKGVHYFDDQDIWVPLILGPTFSSKVLCTCTACGSRSIRKDVCVRSKSIFPSRSDPFPVEEYRRKNCVSPRIEAASN